MKKELLNQLRGMTEREVYKMVYCDSLTDTLNRRAFEQLPTSVIAIIDIDSLKYVNDTYGYRQGDCLIDFVARNLVARFGAANVYRLGGDEFAICAESAIYLRKGLSDIRSLFPCFSFGLGLGLEAADKSLKKDKERREECALRAPRGECPWWADALFDKLNVNKYFEEANSHAN